MTPDDFVNVNGRTVRRSEATVNPFDRGLLYGDGLFETTRIIDGGALFIERHLDRLAASCAELGFGVALDTAGIATGVAATTEANGVEEGYLRITVTRGPYTGALTALECEEPTVLIEARAMDLAPLDAVPPITLARSPHARNEQSPIVRHKSTSYQLNALALAEGRGRGADEVYFLNSRGELTEGAISNLFWVKGGAVFTADVECGLLPGITRQVALELCAELAIPAEVGAYREPALLEADEVFCTNSLRGLMPVSRVLGPAQPTLHAFPLTERLRSAYCALARA